MLQRTAVLHLILYLGIKGGDVRRDEVQYLAHKVVVRVDKLTYREHLE